MAPMWNAALAAIDARDRPERFARFAERVARAPAAIARFGVALLTEAVDRDAPLTIVTVSFSATVLHVLTALARERAVRVACSESRPALEGRALASRLAAAGVAVELFGDAAIGAALVGADAVLTGADAVTPDRIVNKSGTRMLAAAGARQGVPLYVIAARDKCLDPRLAPRLLHREGEPAEVWDAPPEGVVVRNPYFEAVPLDLVAALITDAGVVGPADAPALCETPASDEAVALALGIGNNPQRF
jgi:translation initiation factor 2B subunit (eIF-2B alpha/beta/delta family)